MKNLRVILILLIVMAVTLTSGIKAQQEETLTNQDVIAMTKAGLNQALIIAKIRSARGRYDLSTDALIELKKIGVKDEVVGAMLERNTGTVKMSDPTGDNASVKTDFNDPTAPHDIGIFYYQEKEGVRKMTEMEPNSVTQSRTGGLFTSAITYGIGKAKVKAKLPGASANLQINESQPVFYFYLNEKDKSMSAIKYFPASVNQFQLVRLGVKDNAREITVGKMNAFGGKFGISDEYVVQFSFEKLRDGVYRVTPKAPLSSGEYGFYLIGTGEAVGATFFDFGVQPPKY